MIGDRRKYLSALVSLDPDAAMDYAKQNGIPFREIDDLVKNEKIIKLIESEVAEKNKSFASYETVKKITLVPEFTIENNMMTPTFKIKRNVIREQYKDEIDAMYPDD